MRRRCHKSYSIGEKRKLLASFERLGLSSRRFCEIEGIPRATWRDWRKNSKKIKETAINAKRKTLGGQGAKCSIPFRNHLLSLMKDVRRDEHILTSMHMITFMKTYYEDWLTTYTEGKRDGYKSLLKLCQDFARRHNFLQRVPCYTKIPTVDMELLRDEFAARFWVKYNAYDMCDIINVDETMVNYKMPPGKIWAEKGGSFKVRLTAVLSCRANGEKLPILFIVHGNPSGPIDTKELATYPEGHYYDVQESAWMDNRVWKAYLEVMPPHIIGPSVFVVDYFDAHVTQASADMISGERFSVLEPLPANCTSVCQPLDVGVMGPFKKLLRTLWPKEKPVTTAAEKRMAMIKRSIAAWEMIHLTRFAIIRKGASKT
ncbi:hypothetical protein AaE_013015 [Aphanomyces astaci]|uniref:DDE-1 domain-containing protein n=1 Tax=Aphanomyces astaci TaxID=112090 RepID=A0A6A4ZN27_APHAT|nr:hypothetical protein AaE_013015 [Aphanomyces astaci]